MRGCLEDEEEEVRVWPCNVITFAAIRNLGESKYRENVALLCFAIICKHTHRHTTKHTSAYK